MEGDCLSCMKYLMFIFNFFIFVGGSVLLAVGGWVLFDPLGFRELVASNPLLFTGVYLLLALGSLLFLLGFLGCCGSIRENKCLLLFFFMLILFIFLSELAAAVLAFLFREHMTREFFTRELKRHYQGHNKSDVFTSTWNAVMSSFECCGVTGPQDFDDSLFRLLNPSSAVPEACCHREGALQSRAPERQGPPHGRGPGRQVETTGAHAEGGVSALELCVSGATAYHTNYKGCYSSLVDYFETYIYSAGALAIIVLTIELFAMVFSMCLFRGIQ